ncbi:MAG: type II and III secretion system protein family protein [Stellaceae bacterium]
MRNLLAIATAASGLVLCVAINAAEAQTLSAATAPTATPPPPVAAGVPANIHPTGPPIVLEVGKGTLFHLPRPAATVFVANPDVADVQVKSPSLIYLSANKSKPGETVVYAVDDKENVLVNAVVIVEYDLSRLRQSLKQLMPGEPISVSTVQDKLVLSGNVSSAAEAEKAQAMAAAFVDKDTMVVNQLTVVTPNQVNLRVRIAEVQRSVLKQLGINWTKLGDHFTFTTANPTSGIGLDLVGTDVKNTAIAALGRAAGMKNAADLLATIDALSQEGLLTTLAEPNMTAMNGQTATFLVGGQFPVPTSVTAATGGSAPTIGITYKDFGVKLDFTPTILNGNHLNLKLRPEVSNLSTNGAISLPLTDTAAITVPALTVTRAETTLELASGQSFALAGLLRHDTNQIISKVPWLGDMPILGQLFRSDQFQRGETELVIIVTPYLVNPVAMASAMAPTDGFVAPHDIARVTTDDTYRKQLPVAPRGPLPAGSTGLIGPVGFRLD